MTFGTKLNCNKAKSVRGSIDVAHQPVEKVPSAASPSDSPSGRMTKSQTAYACLIRVALNIRNTVPRITATPAAPFGSVSAP